MRPSTWLDHDKDPTDERQYSTEGLRASRGRMAALSDFQLKS
jgi:hypothetical protein